ncbi:hypothetical protein [Virgibacillus pantothenticus]|nr:hypothetical protein [Virgibacillus pantothenticus]
MNEKFLGIEIVTKTGTQSLKDSIGTDDKEVACAMDLAQAALLI